MNRELLKQKAASALRRVLGPSGADRADAISGKFVQWTISKDMMESVLVVRLTRHEARQESRTYGHGWPSAWVEADLDKLAAECAVAMDEDLRTVFRHAVIDMLAADPDAEFVLAECRSLAEGVVAGGVHHD